MCVCCNRNSSDKRSQKPKTSYADRTRRQEVVKFAVEYDGGRRQLQFGSSTVYICQLIHKWNQTITETAIQCCVLFCNLYVLFSDNSRCMSIIHTFIRHKGRQMKEKETIYKHTDRQTDRQTMSYAIHVTNIFQ